MRIIPYILYLLLIAFFRINLSDIFAIGGIEIILTPLLVILVALYKEPIEAVWFGFAAGLVYDATDPSHLGIQMLILSLMGVATAHIKERFNLDSLKSRVVIVGIALIIYAIPHTLIYTTSGTSEFLRLMFYVTLPSAIYTTIVAWIFFLFRAGHLSYGKLKSLF